jgi:hypothetical protein
VKKISLIILIGSVVLTAVTLAIWLAGLVIGETFGGLIHVLLLLSFITGFGILVGLVLLVISLVQKK